jgi:hypothetical protein
MKITTDTVRRLAARAGHATAGAHGLAFVATPGDPERYVDKQTGGRVFAGRGATRAAAAFYAGILDTLAVDRRGLVDAVLAETGERHGDDIDAGRRAAGRLSQAPATPRYAIDAAHRQALTEDAYRYGRVYGMGARYPRSA